MSKDWKSHQAAVARAFRMVETSVRVAPPDCPDSVDVDIVRKRLALERFDDGTTSSAFLPEAKSGYSPGQVWIDIQRRLGCRDRRRKVITGHAMKISNDGDPLLVALLGVFSGLLRSIELDKRAVTVMVTFEHASVPRDPVKWGFAQLERYIRMPQYSGKKPVVVWHFDRCSFKNDLCFFREADLREVGENMLKIIQF